MRERLYERYCTLRNRLQRLERRELYELRQWLEETRNLVHLSIVVFVPLVIGLVTWLSNAVDILPYLLFPPLASGTYTLFAEPDSEYASPRRFIGGLTTGALCGWLAYELWPSVGGATSGLTVSPGAAAFSVFLTGLVTWLVDLEEASAFSSALLVHIIDAGSATGIPVLLVSGVTVTLTPQLAYVVSVFVSATLVAGVFVVWHREFYEQRAEYLYESTKGDDHVLVPMRTDTADRTAMLGARLAAAHDAGKVVLLDIVSDEETAVAERQLIDHTAGHGAVSEQAPSDLGTSASSGTVPETASDHASRLEQRATEIETRMHVPCEVVVAVETGSTAALVRQVARQANCDLIATPYEQRHGSLSPFVRSLFQGEIDVLVHRSQNGRTEWPRVLVPVRGASDVAHAMIDFAIRLAGQTGHIGVSHSLEQGESRRHAQAMLSNLVEPFDGPLETLVSHSGIERFLTEHAPEYDLIFMGASMDRSRASRLISPPTFERVRDLDCDVAIVDRNYRS